MSCTASRNYRTASILRDRINASDAKQDVLDYLRGRLSANPHHVDIEWLQKYAELDGIAQKKYLEGHTALAKQMARVYSASSYEMSFEEVLNEARAQRRVLRWMFKNEELCREIGLWSHRPFPEALTQLGVDGAKSAQRFADFYVRVYRHDRVWLSHYQVSQDRVAAIALTPNYNRLPQWVRNGLVKAPASARIGGDRIGNIWRLIPCVRAWRWAPLPKRIAEKVGKRSPKFRMLAAVAWKLAENSEADQKISEFWRHLAALQRASLLQQVSQIFKSSIDWGRTLWKAFLSASLGIPFSRVWLSKDFDEEEIEEIILNHGTPKQVCQILLGVSGKATVKAFQAAKEDSWRWASAIAYGNADAIQKILGMQVLIPYEAEAVEFLRSLPMTTRLRMLQATEFKYRGQISPVSRDHVRDTGYLWGQLQPKPELGRVRCWFSVHETLAKAFVENLPDEDIPIPEGWERVNGLCSVDGSWDLEFPTRVNRLKYYGKLLSNCVGGYAPAIKSGRSVVFVVREFGQITHCVEVADGEIRQFYQARNQEGDRALRESVEAALRQAQLIQ